MGNYFSKSKRVERIPTSEIKEDIATHITWFEEISRKERTLLKNYLLHLDKYHIDADSERTNAVHRGVNEIVKRISEKISEYDPRFRGRLIPMGSAHNQTKVGDSGDFDYVYELSLSALFGGRGYFQKNDEGWIVLNIDGDWETSCYTDRNMYAKVRSPFLLILSKVLSELELPIGWKHGGITRPSFSGLRLNGPSIVLQFEYLTTSDQPLDKLCLSIDFVPMIKSPFLADQNISDLGHFVKAVSGIEYGWVSVCKTFVPKNLYYSRAEELFLDKYSWESTTKKLMRICKALRIVLHMHLTAHPSRIDISLLLDANIDSQIEREHHNYSSDRRTDYITYSDLGETGIDNYIVKSYKIKWRVLRMMYEDESNGCGWTDDDLPELVVMVMVALDIHLHVGYHGIRGELVKQTISIPLNDVCETTTLKESPHTQRTTTYLTEIRRLKKLFLKVNAAHIEDRVCCLNKLAGMFQLFRCVCEEKGSAKVLIYHYIDLEDMVSKKELKKMTDRIKKGKQKRHVIQNADNYIESQNDTL